MCAPYGQWSFVRVERSVTQQLYTSVVGFSRTATYTAVVELLQVRRNAATAEA